MQGTQPMTDSEREKRRERRRRKQAIRNRIGWLLCKIGLHEKVFVKTIKDGRHVQSEEYCERCHELFYINP